jgi:hypothetical protein
VRHRGGEAFLEQLPLDPQVAPPGFSLAIRRIRSRTVGSIGGRPGLLRPLDPSLFSSWRRQRFSVSGTMGKADQRS